MVSRRNRWFVVVVAMIAVAFSAARTWGENRPAPQAAGPLADASKLMAELGFSDQEVSSARGGTAVARILKDSGDEAGQAGAVWIGVPVDFFVTKYQDIEAFEASDSVTAIKKMASPPVAADLAPLSFSQQDIDDLLECRVGDCAIKIDEAGLQKLSQIDGSVADAAAEVQAAMREILFGYLTAYEQSGDAGLPTLVDKKDAKSMNSEFEGILADSAFMSTYSPGVLQFIKGYPGSASQGLTSFYYGMVANIGLKPIVRMNHVAVATPEQAGGSATVLSSVQLYASHYFYAALELYYLFPGATPADGFMLVAVNHSRSDGLTGFTGRIVRGKAERRGRDALQGFLESAKTKYEGEYKGQ